MKTIVSVREMQKWSDRERSAQKTIGLVPTMGFLHDGHRSLIDLARKACDVVVVSVFVNPAQFAPAEDLSRYPRDLARDGDICRSAGVDCMFVPDAGSMYPDEYETYVIQERASTILEGKFRPTHFRGVATIVARLFLISKPHKAFFGQKDAQQCVVVKRMVRDLNFDVEIVVAPIVRDADGLAKSSRNVYLSEREREDALILNSSLREAEALVSGGTRSAEEIVSHISNLIKARKTAAIDYVSIVNAETLEALETIAPGIPVLIALAVRFGSTRLIDNTIVQLD